MFDYQCEDDPDTTRKSINPFDSNDSPFVSLTYLK